MRQFRVGDTITFSNAPGVVWRIVAETWKRGFVSGYDVVATDYGYDVVMHGPALPHHVSFLDMARNATFLIPYIEPEPKFTRDEIVGMFAR